MMALLPSVNDHRVILDIMSRAQGTVPCIKSFISIMHPDMQENSWGGNKPKMAASVYSETLINVDCGGSA